MSKNVIKRKEFEKFGDPNKKKRSGMRIGWQFLKTWREKYKWPLHESRSTSERRIISLERLVRGNILKKGTFRVKNILSKIVAWKTGGRYLAVQYFLENSDEYVENTVMEVLGILKMDSSNVFNCINLFRDMRGVGIPVASTFLRFLDPIEHKYGIIDKNIASFLNRKGITDFSLESNRTIKNILKNVYEYCRFHYWLHKKAEELNEKNITFRDIYGGVRSFAPVDVEMALFAYTTQCNS